MSGIAGTLHFDGSPVDPELLKRMTDALAHRGPDGVGYWTDGSVGMGHRQFWTTPEALHERQPLHDAEARLCLTFDGRLDNREELAAALRGKGAVLRDDTDAELVLRAYEAWGDESPQRMLGDFAYAIWDGTRRRLLCARDIIGVRPFYYTHRGSFFAFTSEVQALFRDIRIRSAPNEGMIAEYLAWQITSYEDTLFDGINRLPPAHCLTVDATGKLTIWRYWTVDFTRRLPCKSDAEYARLFFEILRETVWSRLRVHGAIGSELSGGLDSSTVSVTAHTLMRERVGKGKGFQTYSMLYPNLPCDESALVRATIEQQALNGQLLELQPLPKGYYEKIVSKYRDFPGYANGEEIYLAVAGAMKGRHRTVLTGNGGNEWLEGSLDYLADLVANRKFHSAWQIALRNRETQGCSVARILFRHAVRPLWPQRFGSTPMPDSGFPWLNKSFVARTELEQRLRARPTLPPGGSRMQIETYAWALGAHQNHYFEMIDRQGFQVGIEYRHPLLDRRMIDFGFALPGDQRWREGKPKTVLRNAMSGWLPSCVLERAVQADFTCLIVLAIEDIRLRWPIQQWTVGERGWVDLKVLERQYELARRKFQEGKPWPGRVFWRTWMAYGLSLWASQETVRQVDGHTHIK